MKAKITFNGRPFNTKELARALEEAATKAVKRELPKRIARKLRNPRTGEEPKVTLDPNVRRLHDLNGSKIKVQGSAKLIDRLKPERDSQE